jgi:hypothetical protein
MLNNPVDKLDHYKERAKELGISLEAYLLLVAIAELQSIKINTYERSY